MKMVILAFTEKSAIKNLKIAKAYRQQTAYTRKVLELLRYLESLVTIIIHRHLTVSGVVN